jgi:DNA-binding transcriptional LysR family regulator
MLDWNLIRSFLAVAEAGSLSAAARNLSASQPTLGRHVAELEAELGVALFQRTRTGYQLTPTGIALLERAREVAARADAFERLAAGQTETIAGTVRVAASEVVAAFVLPSILSRLRAEEPGIEIELVASNLVENLLRRDADIAVRMVRPSQQDLVARKIADIELGTFAAESYLARRGCPAGPGDLLAHDLVGYDRSDDIIRAMRVMGLPAERSSFKFRTDNQIVGWQAVRAGVGIGFTQVRIAERDPLVRRILPDVKLPSLPMWLAMHPDLRTSPRVRRVADLLAVALSDFFAEGAG